MTQKRPELIELLFGFFPAQVIQVAARLAIADHLAGRPRSTAQLAASTGTDEAALYRLLRALVCIEVLDEATPGSFALTERGELLRSDVAGLSSLRATSPGSARLPTSAAATTPCWPPSWKHTRRCAASCSEEEFRTVFAAAGLTLRSVTRCPGPTNVSVLEAVRADAG